MEFGYTFIFESLMFNRHSSFPHLQLPTFVFQSRYSNCSDSYHSPRYSASEEKRLLQIYDDCSIGLLFFYNLPTGPTGTALWRHVLILDHTPKQRAACRRSWLAEGTNDLLAVLYARCKGEFYRRAGHILPQSGEREPAL